MERWNSWWWAPDEWRTGPGMDDQETLAAMGGGGGGGGATGHAMYKAADPGSACHGRDQDQG